MISTFSLRPSLASLNGNRGDCAESLLSTSGGRERALLIQTRLVDDDQRTKAACWAYFAGEEEPAVNILMNSAASESCHFRILTLANQRYTEEHQIKRGQ